MTDDTKPTAKVVSLCGRPIDLTAGVEPPAAIEARRAKEQLAYWGPKCARYLALFVTEDGQVALCGSMDSPAEVLQFAGSLHRLAADMAHIDLTGEAPVYDEAELVEELPDEPA